MSTYALREGFLDAGIRDGDVLIFSELMDSQVPVPDRQTPTPSISPSSDARRSARAGDPDDSLGIVDDMWFRWVTDFGLPGADRGQGGTYLLVAPGYDGPVPEGGHYVRHAHQPRAAMLGRAFIDHNEGNDPAPTVARIKEKLKIYPYPPGGSGSIGSALLTGRGPLGTNCWAARALGSSKAPGWPSTRSRPTTSATTRCSTLWCRWSQPRRSTPESWRSLAAIGIVKGKPSRPTPGCADPDQAVAVGNAAARTLGTGCPPDRGVPLLRRRRLRLVEHAVRRRVRLQQPAADDHRGRHQALPEQGCPPLHSRTSMFFYTATGITPAMCMRLTGVGSQYLLANVDADGEQFDGAKTYRVTVAQGHPGRPVLVLHRLRQPDPLHAPDTPQRYPRAGSQSFPTRRRGRARRLHRRLLLTHPAGRSRRRQLDPDRPRQGLVRHPAPVQPAPALLRRRPGTGKPNAGGEAERGGGGR